MATFRERYEELFGPTPDPDPVQIEELADAGERRALTTLGEAPTASPALDFPAPPGPATEPQGALTGLLKTGSAQLAEGVLGAGEYLARQNEFTQGTDVEGFLNYGRDRLAQYREDIYSRMDPEAVDLKGREFLTLDPDRTIWQGSPLKVGQAILYKLIEQIPMSVATLLPGAIALRAGATAKGLSYLGASEAGLSLGFIQNEIADGIAEMSDEELATESPRFSQMLEEYGDSQQARSVFTAEAQGAAPVIGGLLVGAVSAAAGRYLSPSLTGEIGRLGQRIRRGAVAEGLLQEGPQETLEQVVGNIAAAAYDGDREALEGAAEAYVQGAVVGGPLGGAVAGFLGRAAPEAAPEGDPGADPTPQRALPFGDVFGEGGESPFIAPDAPPEVEPTLDADGIPSVPEDIQAAVSANIRADAKMDDLLEPVQFADTEQARYLAGQPTTPTQQGEMFPTAAPNAVPEQSYRTRGRAIGEVNPETGMLRPGRTGQKTVTLSPRQQTEVPGVLVQPEETVTTPEQGVLPMVLRERGRPLLQESPRGARVPTELPALEEETLPTPPARLPQGEDLVTQDMFNQPRTTALRRQAEVLRTSNTGATLVTLYDENGEVIDTEVFDSVDEAEVRGDELYQDFPDGYVSLTPERKTSRKITGLVKRPIGGELPQSELEKAEAARKEAAPTEAELALRKATRDLPFEERSELENIVGGATTTDEAAKRLVAGASEQIDTEQERRIGGALPPSAYKFNNRKYEAQYKALWDLLLTQELIIENKKAIPLENRGTAVAAAKRKKAKILPQLTKIRQLDNPTRSVQKKALVARDIDRKTVEEGRGGKGEPARTRDYGFTTGYQGEAVPVVDSVEEELIAREGEISPITRAVSKVAKDLDTTDPFDTLPDMKLEEVRKLNPVDLDFLYEKALRYLEGTQWPTKFRLLTAEKRRRITAPSLKRKLIMRAMVKQKNRAESASRAGGQRVARAQGEPASTAALSAITYKAEETKADKLKREQKARVEYRALAKNVKAAAKRLSAIEPERDFENELTPRGREQILIKQYISQVIQLGAALSETQQNDSNAIKLARTTNKLLENVADFSEKRLMNLIKKQEQAADAFLSSKSRTVTKVEGRKDRATAIAKQNKELFDQIKNRKRRDEVWKKDSIYMLAVDPLVRKFSESYWTADYYTPSLEEAQMLQWAMREWRRDIPPGTRVNFYTPIRRTMTSFGFKFDAEGGLIVDTDKRGNFVFSPAYRLLIKPAPTKQVLSVVLPPINPTEQARRIAEGKARKAGEAQTEANRHARATAIFAAFRKVVDNKKSTINRLIDAEEKMLADLKAEGFIKQQGSAVATISVPGRNDITFRKSASDLANERINKTQARRRMTSVNKRLTTELAAMRDMADPTSRDLTGTQTADESFEYTYELEAIDIAGNSEAYTEAAQALGNQLEDISGPTPASDLIGTLADLLPAESVYGTAARKLQALSLDNIEVSYDWGNTLPPNIAGRYNTQTGTVLLNRAMLQRMRKAGDESVEAKAIHALLHETLHAATQQSLSTNADLRQTMMALRAEMRAAFEEQFPGQPLPYGLSVISRRGKEMPVDEFVVEMFSNPEMQGLAKRTRVTRLPTYPTLWQTFKQAVYRLLGRLTQEGETVFDIVMELESELFARAGETSAAAELLDMDVPLGRLGGSVLGRVKQAAELESSFRRRATAGVGTRMLHNILSMRQLREVYEKYFTDGSLGDYMNAFTQRNSRNNELMQLPEKMSRRWTELTDKDFDTAVEFSRIATEATLHKVAPHLPLSDKRNKNVKSEEQKKVYRELKKRYDALPKEWKNLWNAVTKYYGDSLRDETNLMLLNAIRGVVTSGNKNNMDVKTFNRKYDKGNISQYNTAEKLEAEFGEFLGEGKDDMIGTLLELSRPPGMTDGVFFPLMRYGDWAVYMEQKGDKEYFADSKAANGRAAELRAKDPTVTVEVIPEGDGRYSVRENIKEFVTAESLPEIEAERERLIAEYPNAEIGDANLKVAENRDAAIANNAQLNTIINALGENRAAASAVKQFYLKSLSDRSFRKREIKRQNRRGVNYDLQHRNFANYAKQSSYYRAQLEYGGRMASALNSMRNFAKNRVVSEEPPALQGKSSAELTQVFKSLDRRDELSTDPTEVNKLVRGGVALTQFYMLTSASYHMINMSQPWMVTAPTMAARHGWGPTLSAMKSAQNLIKAPLKGETFESWFGLKAVTSDTAAEKAFGVFDTLKKQLRDTDSRAAEHIKMLDELRKTQVLEVSPLTELREVASGQRSKVQRVLDASRIMAHIVEVNNRVLTAISAYDLEFSRQVGEGAGTEAASEAATRYAEKMVSQTQFDYSTANKPPLFQKLPLLFQFMQWSQHIYAHLIRNFVGAYKAGLLNKSEARTALFGLLGTHAAVGGMIGVALQPIKMAVGMAMMALGDEDEPYTLKNALSGATFDRLTEGALGNVFGTTVGTALSRGLPAALGADLSTRMSLGTLYFIDIKPENAETLAGSLAMSFGGAFVNQLGTFYRGASYLGSGDIKKAVEAFSPKFLRDILKSGRLMSDGLVNNAGDTVLDTNDLGFVDVALQAIGFTPTTASKFYQGQGAIKDAEMYVRRRKSALLKDFRTSAPGGRSRVIQEVLEFNRAYPQEAITRSALLRNLQSKMERERQYRKYGAAIDERKAELYKGYGEPYR